MIERLLWLELRCVEISKPGENSMAANDTHNLEELAEGERILFRLEP